MINPLVGQYIKKESPVHSLHPLTKVTLLFLVALFIVLKSSWYNHLLAATILIISTLLSRLTLHRIFALLKTFWIFIALTFLIHLLFTPAPGEIKWAFFHISLNGLNNGLLYSFRVFLLIWAASLFGWTTSPIELGDSMEKILAFAKIFGISPRDIATVFVISMRFIPTLMDDAQKILWAQKARGIDFSGSIWQKVKNIIPLEVPLFVVAFHRADKLALSLQIRGYSSNAPRTRIFQPEPRTIDFVVPVFIAALMWTTLVFLP